MPDENGPWEYEPEDEDPGSPMGWILWVVLLVAVGIGIWLISALLPGRIASDRDSQIEIVRLVALLALVSSGLIFARQIKLGEVVRNISIWVGLAAIIVVGYSFRTELEQVYNRVSSELVPSQAVALSDDELVVTASGDGHFYINGRANGERIRFMVDTGASGVTLSPQDAARIGIDMGALRFTQRFQTANGVGLGAPYRLDSMLLGSFAFADMPVSINEAEMSTSLLGMSALERLTSFEFRDGKLYLRR